MIAMNHDERHAALGENIQCVFCTCSLGRKIARADNDIGLNAGRQDHIGGIFVAVQVGEGENFHDLAYRNKIAPSRAEKVENTFTKFSGSFRKNTPIRRAKTMLVSRSAVTNAIGAWVKAHVTTA